VLVDGRAIHLTPKEFALLTLLASDPGRVFSKAEIIAAVWPGERGYGANDVHQCVRHLRAKIEPDAGHPRWVETVPGFGYRLRPGVLGN
jgi:DNA-binding response OmpR family regulator